MKMKQTRNGKIDILKFVLALNIMILHYRWRPVLFSYSSIELALGNRGSFAVVVFFVISGCLMVRSYYFNSAHAKHNNYSVGMQTKIFLKKKLERFLPLYLFAMSFYPITDYVVHKSIWNIMKNLFYSIPSCFLLGYTGFDNKEVYNYGYYVGASWYISALIMMLLVVYPLMCINYDTFTKVISPIVFVIAMYINVSIFHINIIDSRLYPVIPFVLGIIVGDLSIDTPQWLTNHSIVRWGGGFLEIVLFLFLQVYLCMNTGSRKLTEYPMLFITAIFIYITVIDVTPGKKIFNNSISYYLGDLSFSLYLIHVPIFELFHAFFPEASLTDSIMFIIPAGISLILSAAVLKIYNIIGKKINKVK